MKSKIILLNGPRGCGKTEAVKKIRECSTYPIKDRRCKDHLWCLTREFFCMTSDEFFSIYEDRETKEKPVEEFSVSLAAYNALAPHIGIPPLPKKVVGDDKVKLSVREALIYVSEVLCKPTFGEDYFGAARAKAIRPDEKCVDDSCGFDDEIEPTIKLLGQDNILLIRIHGRGDFKGDSRNFISNGVVNNTVDIENTADEESFLNKIISISDKFFTP